MRHNIILSLKRYGLPMALAIFWLVANIILCDHSYTKEGLKVATAEEALAYANFKYGRAELVDYVHQDGFSRTRLRDTALDFEYDVTSSISKQRDILPYYIRNDSNFLLHYMERLRELAEIDGTSIKLSEFPDIPEVHVKSMDFSLADQVATKLLSLDTRRFLDCIYLQDLSGNGLGCYEAHSGKYMSQEVLDQRYFDYQFQCIMEYPYEYQFLYSESVTPAQVPGVDLADVYAYYETCSSPVPTIVTLYWFEIGYRNRYFIASLKGMNGHGKYYTNFKT